MAHLFRFLGQALDDKMWQLDADEAHHLVKVLRLDVGAEVEVTDGKGSWANGIVCSANHREALVTTSGAVYDPEPVARLGFAVGALKPGAIDEILPTLVELGMDELHVFAQIDSSKSRLSDKALERWRRILVQSVKQCKRSRIPALTEHASVYDFAQAVTPAWPRRVLLSESAAERTLSALLAAERPRSLLVTAGGEKGFSPTEAKLLTSAQFTPARLGPNVLRAVTAVLASAAVLSLYREDLGHAP